MNMFYVIRYLLPSFYGPISVQELQPSYLCSRRQEGEKLFITFLIGNFFFISMFLNLIK